LEQKLEGKADREDLIALKRLVEESNIKFESLSSELTTLKELLKGKHAEKGSSGVAGGDVILLRNRVLFCWLTVDGTT